MKNALLIVGYRQGIVKACKEIGLPFFIWSERAPKYDKPSDNHLIYPFSSGKKDLLKSLSKIHKRLANQITHVIPCTEKSVIPSSLIAKKLGATGIAPITAWRCSDKLLMKNFLKEHAVPMARYRAHRKNMSLDSLESYLRWPIVAKFRKESGGKGISISGSKSELESYWTKGRIFEQYIDSNETSVESLVVNGKIVFTNITEYYKKQYINILPAKYDDQMKHQIIDLNRVVIEALGIKNGMTHLEMYLTKQGPVFGEIAHRPPGGYIMKLIELSYGFCPWRAYIEASMSREPSFQKTPRSYSAAHVIYPGPGAITSLDLEGWRDLKKEPGVKRVKLKVSEGDTLGKRTSSGQDAGYVIQQNETYKDLIQEVDTIDAFISRAMRTKYVG